MSYFYLGGGVDGEDSYAELLTVVSIGFGPC